MTQTLCKSKPYRLDSKVKYVSLLSGILMLLAFTAAWELTRCIKCDSKSKDDSMMVLTNITELATQRNNTLCSFIRQIEISESKRVTVCIYQDNIRIDIRHFNSNNKASIKGIWLSTNEWETLMNYSPWVNSVIEEALSKMDGTRD